MMIMILSSSCVFPDCDMTWSSDTGGQCVSFYLSIQNKADQSHNILLFHFSLHIMMTNELSYEKLCQGGSWPGALSPTLNSSVQMKVKDGKTNSRDEIPPSSQPAIKRLLTSSHFLFLQVNLSTQPQPSSHTHTSPSSTDMWPSVCWGFRSWH